MNVATLITKTRGRSLGELLRGFGVSVWPLSRFMRLYYRLRFQSPIYKALNRDSSLRFEGQRLRRDEFEETAVDSLKSDGIVVTSIEAILPEVDWPSLRAGIMKLLASPEIQTQISARRSKHGDKWYVVRALGRGSSKDLPSCLMQALLNRRLINIANSTLGVYSRLIYSDCWHNLVALPGEPTLSSECWHRDHEDWRIIKVFIYLDDVTEDSGPFCFIRGSHTDGDYGWVLSQCPGMAYYPREEEIWRQIPRERSMVCTGKAGTVIIFNASGFHRGGRSVTTPRTVAVGTYATNAAILSTRYRLPITADGNRLGDAARFAIRMRARPAKIEIRDATDVF